MDIKSFFQITLNADQENVIQNLEDFLESDDSAFLVKGYAGTGKTTLIKGVIDALNANKKRFVVCAPTGRAAKILRNKTGYGKTIHSTIYDFDNLKTINSDKEDFAEHSFQYYFPVVKLEQNTIIIVDEASMISSRENKNELFTFGSNILLNDLLTFAQLHNNTNNKIIFVGDPAQLAPVGDNNSWALETSFFAEKTLSVREVFLKQIMRQKDNLILDNALSIRNCINDPTQRELKFKFDEESCHNFNSKNIVEKYCTLFPKPNFDSGVIINYSNAQNYWYNKEIREKYFPDSPNIAVGDLVQIINNNYHKYKTEIYNGEFALVVNVDAIVKQSAPIFVDVNGEKKKKVIELTYRKVSLRLPDFDEDIEAYINETLLECTSRDLKTDEMKAVYINTVMRFREAHPNSKINSEEFKNFLKKDDFYNAIRIKYGYSITGHKAQGGEWKQVFVDYSGRASLSKDPLRWSYTATTRASEILYAINFPDFGQFYNLKFSNVGSMSSVPNNALNFEKVPTSPFHQATAHKCKSWLYWNVLEKLEDSDFIIDSIISEEYCEKYTFRYFEKLVSAQIFHKLSGFYEKDFILTAGNDETFQKLQEVLIKPNQVQFPSAYRASEAFLEDIYSIISAACTDLGIQIYNVVENIENYNVAYYFETFNKLSCIQFCFKKSKEFTTAMVKTSGHLQDEKLIKLIEKITEYATISTN
ncbi:ATP-dependent DNA helicase [Chryseobacterium oryzae]|uniref:AAA family ATPase n=1 Tax=Chryseobacterium oryzae TaxID=2929799 RepID=A0ABY4BKJ9_9FLAO|nr:AAA family ATPase [Chryseobacterium oryzae]UOE39712.1 AAA family ATPase [Chryseobacterium oryzae]